MKALSLKRTLLRVLALALSGSLLACEQAAPTQTSKNNDSMNHVNFQADSVMSEQEFWRIIEFAHQHAGGDGQLQQALLVKSLSQHSPGDIVEFECIMRQNIIAADEFRVLAAAKIIDGSVSDDSYLYFRCGLVMQGERVFKAALQDPDSLAEIVAPDDDISFEDLLYVATEAFENKTGEKQENDSYPRSVADGRGLNYDFGAVTKGEDWTPEQLPALLPNLWAKFN